MSETPKVEGPVVLPTEKAKAIKALKRYAAVVTATVIATVVVIKFADRFGNDETETEESTA